MTATLPILDAIERHRDFHFRRTPTRCVAGAIRAQRFIEESGFCMAFTAGRGIPCLREAVVGAREPVADPHIQHDYGVVTTWRLKDDLPARRLVYYGKAIGGRPSFISREMLAPFLRLRAAGAGYESMYRRGSLSHCAKLVMDTLVKRHGSETRALKLASGHAEPRRRAQFDRAMTELQEKMLALKVGERTDPFSYVWDTLAHRWPDAMREAKSIAPADAAYRIVRRYFEIAGCNSERAVARMLSIDAKLFDRAMARLERERIVVRGARIDGIAGIVAVLAALT